jgi:hypothetical protein
MAVQEIHIDSIASLGQSWPRHENGAVVVNLKQNVVAVAESSLPARHDIPAGKQALESVMRE